MMTELVTYLWIYSIHVKSSSVTEQPGLCCETKLNIAKLLLILVLTVRCLENAFQSILY